MGLAALGPPYISPAIRRVPPSLLREGFRDFAGNDSNMLVSNKKLGEALTKVLGSHTVVLMRGHGFTVVGGNLKEAVYNAVNTMLAARVQLNAMHLGEVTYLSEGEAATTSKLHGGSLDRMWEIWKKRALGQLP